MFAVQVVVDLDVRLSEVLRYGNDLRRIGRQSVTGWKRIERPERKSNPADAVRRDLAVWKGLACERITNHLVQTGEVSRPVFRKRNGWIRALILNLRLSLKPCKKEQRILDNRS